MAGTISTAKLKVSSTGAKGVAGQLDQVGKATERVGRAQTRLGQASASSGRAFAAQASGLGGLVAAYAGAAATVFALQAAFDALNKAARAETIIQGTKTLATEIGQSGPRILKEIKSITQGQIELSEAAQNINIALSAGFNTEQISRLTKVSLGASRALGRNLTDALQRVVRGAAKLEPELLDELGIFTRIDPAVNKYAQRLGVAASTLTDFERRQAFVNAVITEGERKFSAIDVTSKSTQKSLEQLQTQIQELALQFGGLIANALLPLVSFFKNNVGNTLLLFGGILALVFGKAGEIVGNFSKNAINNITRFADSYADAAAKSKGANDIIIKGQKDLSAVIKQRQGGLKGADGAAGGLFAGGLSRDLSSEAAAARRRFLAGGEIDSETRRKDVKTLTLAQQELTKAGRGTSQAFDDAKKITDTYGESTKKAGIASRGLTVFAGGLQTALKGVAAAARLAGQALNIAFFLVGGAQLIGSLFDIDILAAIKDMFIDTSQASKDLTNGLVGLTTAAVGGGAALSNAINNITQDEEVLENLNATIAKTFKELKNLEGTTQITVAAGTLGQRTQQNVQDFGQAAAFRKQQLEDEINLLSRMGQLDFEKIESLKVQLEIVNALNSANEKFGLENQRIAGQLARITGLNFDKIPETFQDSALGVKNLNGELTIAGIKIPKIGGEFNLSGLNDGLQQAIEANTIFNSVLTDTNEAFAAGALNSDKLSAKIAGLSSQFVTIKEKGELSAAELAKLNKELERLRVLQTELKAVEQVSTGIAKAFSSAFTALDTAPFKGLIDLSGNLAKNSEVAKKNQAEFLMSVMTTNKFYADLVKAGGDFGKANSIVQGRAQNFNLAVKAAAGSIIEYYTISQKVIDAEKIKTAQLEKQGRALLFQLEILNQDIFNKNANEVAKQGIVADKTRLDIATKALALSKERFEIGQKDVENERKLAAAQARNAAAQQKIAQIGRQTGANANEAARGLNQGILENQLDILNEKSFKDQTAINAKKRELIELERQYADERFTEQKELINKQLSESLELLRVQETLEKSRLEGLKQQETALEKFNKEQLSIFDQQSALEQQKLINQKDQLERERQIAFTRAGAQLDAIDSEEAIFKQQSELTLRQLKGYESFATTVNSFIEGTGKKSPFVQAVGEILGVAQGQGATQEFLDNLADIPKTTGEALRAAIASTETNIAQQGNIFDLRRGNTSTQLQGANDLNQLQQDGISSQIIGQEKLRQIERDILSTTLAGKAQELAAEIKLQQTKLDGLPLQELELRAQATQKIEELDQQRIKTLETLNQRVDTLARSEDRLGQALDQSQSIVKESFTGAFMKLNDALIDGSITMGMVANTFKDMVGNMLREIQQAVFRKTIVDPLTNAISGSIPGLGSLFGGGINPAAVVSGNVGAPGMVAAAGGRVHMAGGGMKRDRVPAMLEPGEFVMRKEAVKQAGVGTMMRMNAAPQQLQSGGKVMQGNATYSVARAMELEAMGLSPAQARSVAQEEANKSKSVGGAFSFSDNVINSMKGAPSTSTPATPSNALNAVQDMIGIGKQSSLQTSGPEAFGVTARQVGTIIYDDLERGSKIKLVLSLLFQIGNSKGMPQFSDM